MIGMKKSGTPYPGMMGDGTEEQNLGQKGNPAARIKKADVKAAFGKKKSKKKSKKKPAKKSKKKVVKKSKKKLAKKSKKKAKKKSKR